MDWTIAIFVVVYIGMALGSLPGLKVDRAAIALLGAIALLASGKIGQEAAWNSIDFSTIGLLFGLMILSAQFAMAGFYQAVAHYLIRLQMGPRTLLAILVCASGLLGALLTNDVVALAMAPVIIEICFERKLNPLPFLLALACSTNAGSSGTIIGSPQNILIGEKLGLSFVAFLYDAAVPSALSLAAIWAIIAFSFRNKWDLQAGQKPSVQTRPADFDQWENLKALIIAAGIIVAFVATSWPRDLVALTAGGILLLNARFQSKKMLDYEDWQLLVLIMSLFIVNAAFQQTHLLSEWIADLKSNGVDLYHPAWIFALTAMLSDLVSNVPSVMMLLPFATHPLSGPAMALASGLSSNLIVIGSLANIIVIDVAAQHGMKITFWEHARIGIPVTLVSLLIAAGWLWLRAVQIV
jgi:Na+/H+ antiporter NhaD/arsenite permease-like protein